MTTYLDQGRSSSRSIVFDTQGQVVAMAQREFRQIYPQPGWVEHDPMELWQTQLATAREVLAQAGLAATDIASIGITNQRETTLVWNRRTGQPIYNAIVWQDRRAEPACTELRARGLVATFRAKTGLILDAYFSGIKLQWILDHADGARAAQCGATPEFALEGSVFIGGAVVQWLRDGLRAIPGSAHVQALAEGVPDAGGVMFVPAFTGLGSAHRTGTPRRAARLSA